MDRRRTIISPEPERSVRGLGKVKLLVLLASACVFLGLGSAIFMATQRGNASLPPTPFPGSAYVLSGELDHRAPGSYFSGFNAGESVPFGPGSLVRVSRGLLELNLPGNYQLALYGQSEAPALLELAQAGLFGRPSENLVRLLSGSLVAHSGPEVDRRIRTTIVTDSGKATISGTVMGVRFSPETGLMEIDCLVGSCDVETAQAAAIRLEEGQRITIDASGQFASVGIANLELYTHYPLSLWVSESSLARLASAAQDTAFTPTAPSAPMNVTPTETPVLPTWTPAPPSPTPITPRPTEPVLIVPTTPAPTVTPPSPTSTVDSPPDQEPPVNPGRQPTRRSPYGG